MRKSFLWVPFLIPLFVYAGKASRKNPAPLDSAQYIQQALDERATSLEFFKTTTTLSDLSTVSPNTELDRVTPRSWQKKPYIMDGIWNMPVPVGGRWCHVPHHGIYFALQIHADVTVRILANDKSKGDTSSPVRTPSLMPGFTFFITSNKLWNTGEGKPKHYFSLKIYHHSNGQDGYHFTTAGYWNLYNGDFSDDCIFDLGYGGIKSVKKETPVKKSIMGTERTATGYSYYWKGVFSLHPPSGVGPDMREYHIYGYYRTSAQAGFIWAPYYQEYISNHHTKWKTAVGNPVKKEVFRAYATIDYIWDAGLNTGSIYNLSRVKEYDPSKRMNAVITFSARIPGTSFLGLFAQGGYYGSDPYNVYFEQSVLFCRVGVSFGYLINEQSDDRQRGKAWPGM